MNVSGHSITGLPAGVAAAATGVPAREPLPGEPRQLAPLVDAAGLLDQAAEPGAVRSAVFTAPGAAAASSAAQAEATPSSSARPAGAGAA